jgi:hypothetical protein
LANWTGQPVEMVDKEASNIYITCNGFDDADKEVLGTLVYYSILYPSGHSSYGGIPYYFFPYL